MAKKQTCSVTVVFSSPIESTTDKTAIKSAYSDLRKQIQTLAEALAADPNVIISHSTINGLGEDKGTVDAKIAELQTINPKIEQGKSSITDPTYKSKFEPKEVDKDVEPKELDEKDEDVKPRVRSGYWTPPVQNIPAVSATPVAKVDDAQKSKIEVTIFNDLKKTKKSEAIIGYFLNNLNKDVEIADIAKAIKFENKDVSIWLATTGKQIKALTNVGRGTYKFDTSKVE